jgi:hypothetical protein
MLIARQKKQENIAEYILYMWQLEDLMRSLDLNPENIGVLVEQFEGEDDALLAEIRAWYHKMMRDMKSEKIVETGHLLEVHQVLIELYYLHNTLLNIMNDEAYREIYAKAEPNLAEFRKRYGKPVNNEVELCFNALYGWLLLRIQKKQVSAETLAAMQTISELAGYLAARYKQMKSGKLDFTKN